MSTHNGGPHGEHGGRHDDRQDSEQDDGHKPTAAEDPQVPLASSPPASSLEAGLPLESLERRLQDGEATVAILGLGYVGLPLAVAFARQGLKVVGVDIDTAKVDSIEQGRSYIGAVEDAPLQELVEQGKLRATTSFDVLTECDAILICVPTPLLGDRQPDLSYVLATTKEIASRLRAGQLVVLESTTYPGTTDEVLLPILEGTGLRCGKDFLLAFSPEREDPGNPKFHTSNIPKVVGGVDDRSTEVAAVLYRKVVPAVVKVSSAKVAEASKLTENIFRAVNIALVNELKVVYQRLGIDVREVLDAAETKPFGFMRFDPGPGWGGHCIPVDPFYLQWKAEQSGVSARFIELAGQINVEMPRYVLSRLEESLKRELRGARILVLGLAYKKNVCDPRESPAFEILDLLRKAGAEIAYHDPFFATAPAMRSWPHLPSLTSVSLDTRNLRTYHAVVLVTDHDGVNYQQILDHARLVIDTRAVFSRGFDADLVRTKVRSA